MSETPRGRRLLALLLLVLAPACAAGPAGGGGPFPQFAEFEGVDVRRVEFLGETELPVDSLREVVVTRGSRCVFPTCLPLVGLGRDAYELELEELRRDVIRLQLFYRDHGYYGTRVVPSVDPAGDGEVVVRIAIAPGDRVVLRELEVAGVEEALDSAAVRAAIPLEVGEPFRRIGFLASADTIRTRLQSEGYAYADVLRNYQIDTIADVAQAQFIALPGPLVYVDTLLFAGLNRLGQGTLRKQIALQEGELLQLPEVTQSQRNLYDLAMVQFASLEIAPDSLQLDADSATATLLARVVEAPQYVVDVSGGIGSVECIRGEASWLNRNFLGGGRSLEVSGLLSRIGAASPLDFGLGSFPCDDADNLSGEFGRDFSRYLNYRAAARFLQPRLLNTRNELALNLQAERVTDFSAFLRQSVGGQVALSRQIGEDKLLNAALAVERGFTLANPVSFCIDFDVCTLADLARLEDPRWSNVLSATAIWDRALTQGFTTRGFRLRGSVDWATAALGSDDRYARVVAEGSVYRPVGAAWVLAANLRAGTFLQGALGGLGTEGFIPPERRFYGGGPSSVRGYPANALGPTAYVLGPDQAERDADGSAIGGTSTVVASVEARGPSPLLPQLFRVAGFVDAGQVWAPDAEFAATDLRVTPGVGLRVLTPVGPIRLDVAYNGYPPEPGPLYQLDVDGENLILLGERAVFPERSFWSRLQFSFAVGQAF